MSQALQIDELVQAANRTLRAAGYEVNEFQRTLNNAEFRCAINSRLGASLSFLFAFTSAETFSPEKLAELAHVSESQHLALVAVSLYGGDGQVSWANFLRAMGGEVPSWRALQPNYREALITAARDTLPNGETGEAWVLFEELVADGLEFVLGRRVRRFGGKRRGQKVSDMIAQLPNFKLLVVDAKASGSAFNAGWPQLRALNEYVKKQQIRQNGTNEVLAALIVSSAFKQVESGLRMRAEEFLAEARVPLCFTTADTLASMVECFRESPQLRNSLRWYSLFTGGLIEKARVDRAVKEAVDEFVEGPVI
jgi:hypothetical protein